MRLALVGIVLAATALAGCEETTAEQDYDAVAQAYDDMRAEVLAMDVSSSATMPRSGSATFEGYSTIFIDTATADAALVGDAVIDANFSTGRLTGSLSNFIGNVNGGQVQEYDGAIGIREGEIGAVRAEELTADIKGAVSVPGGDSVSINGEIAGRFRDDGAVRAAALTAVDTDSTDFRVNGVLQSDGRVNIVAQR